MQTEASAGPKWGSGARRVTGASFMKLRLPVWSRYQRELCRQTARGAHMTYIIFVRMYGALLLYLALRYDATSSIVTIFDLFWWLLVI